MKLPLMWRSLPSTVVRANGVALFLPHYGITFAALESRRASSGFCLRCLQYSKRGRAAHPCLSHMSGRRAKDSANKVCAVIQSFLFSLIDEGHTRHTDSAIGIFTSLGLLAGVPVAGGQKTTIRTFTVNDGKENEGLHPHIRWMKIPDFARVSCRISSINRVFFPTLFGLP